MKKKPEIAQKESKSGFIFSSGTRNSKFKLITILNSDF
jgi:hypothetical protein